MNAAVARPEPLHTTLTVVPFPFADDVSVITRHWAMGDVKACGLCDRCTASRLADVRTVGGSGGMVPVYTCTVTTEGAVDPASAPGYSLR